MMGFISVDTNYFSKPSSREAGKNAVLLQLAAWTYCNQHNELGNFIIPIEALPLIGMLAFLDEDEADDAAGMLLHLRLWQRCDVPDRLKVVPPRGD
jgi:hypothetical protein